MRAACFLAVWLNQEYVRTVQSRAELKAYLREVGATFAFVVQRETAPADAAEAAIGQGFNVSLRGDMLRFH